MAALTTYAVDKLLDRTLRNTAYTPPTPVYLSLMTVPGAADGSGTEVTGGGFTRQAITFAAAASGAIASNADVAWVPLHTTTDQAVVGWTIWDAASAGNMLAFHTLPSTITVRAGRNVTFTSGTVTITSDHASMTDWLANKWLDHLFRNTAYTPTATVYLAEYTTTPTASTAGTEASVTGYVRKAATFTVAASRSSTTSADITWSPLYSSGSLTLTGWAIVDASTAGNELFFGAYGSSQSPAAADDVQQDAGTLTVTVQ